MPIPTRIPRAPKAKASGATLVMVTSLAIGISFWALLSLRSHQRIMALTAESGNGLGGTRKHVHHTHGLSLYQKCHVDKNNEYHGDVVLWGDKNNQTSESGCCESCTNTPGCNIWVWCGKADGCGPANAKRPYGECWLKKNTLTYIMDNYKKGGPGIDWIAGSVYGEEEEEAWLAEKQRADEAEAQRVAKLTDDPELPLVWMDVSLKGQPIGRIEMVLFVKDSPRAAENMRQLCEAVPGSPYSLKGNSFYRIIDRFIDQTGASVDGIYGGNFHDDPGGLKLKHDRKGLLSMANMGPNTNGGHFSLVMGPAHHLDGSYTIFGEIVKGFEVAEQVNALSKDQPNHELLGSHDAVITDTGQTRRGTYVDTQEFKDVIESEMKRVAWRKLAPPEDLSRMKRLVADEDLPMVFLDVAIQGRYVGRMEFVLFPKDSPLASENFRLLCTGEAGIVPEGHFGAGQPYHFKGTTFYRIIKGFIDQGGRKVESPLGGEFLDDVGGLKINHTHVGLLSMANRGPNTNTAHFSIIMGQPHHLDGKYPVFGDMVDGHHVAYHINELATGKEKKTLMNSPDAVIIDSGEVRRGKYMQVDEFKRAIEAERQRIKAAAEAKRQAKQQVKPQR